MKAFPSIRNPRFLGVSPHTTWVVLPALMGRLTHYSADTYPLQLISQGIDGMSCLIGKIVTWLNRLIFV